MRFCVYGGHVIEGHTRLPGDPVDHDAARLPILGCNRLRCPLCKAQVRSVAQRDARDRRGPLEVAALAALYEVDELAASPLLAPSEGTRLYLCRCTSWAESIGRRPLGGPDPDPSTDPHAPWRCEGHPVPELPHVFDGEEITPDTVGDTMHRALAGAPPAGAAPDDKQRGFWPARMAQRLAGTPWEARAVAALLAGVDDPEPKVRSRALHALLVLERPEGAERAVELLGGDRTGFAGTRDVFTPVTADTTLEESLWRLAAPLVARPGRARELARADALAPGKGSAALYGALASGDAAWVAVNAEEIARATPAAGKALTSACKARFPPEIPWKPVVDRVASVLAAPR